MLLFYGVGVSFMWLMFDGGGVAFVAAVVVVTVFVTV